MIIIKPTGGLCNYLRVIFSYYEYARKNNSELNVIWIEDVMRVLGIFWITLNQFPHVQFQLNQIK